MAAAKLQAALRMSHSLQDWFGATERCPLQLHDMDRVSHLQIKQRELLRQQTESLPSSAN